MRMPLKTLGVALVAAGAFLADSAAAQSIPSPYSFLEEGQELGVFTGVMGVANGRFNFGPKGGPVFGVRYGIELSGPLSFEGVLQYVDATRWVINPGRDPGERRLPAGETPSEEPAAVTTLEARLKFTPLGRRAWHRIAPFLGFGGGLAIDTSSGSELDDGLEPEDRFDFGTSFYGTLSTGLRWYATDRFTVRGDGVFSLWKIDTPPGYADPARGFENVTDGEWVAGTALTLAILYRW